MMIENEHEDDEISFVVGSNEGKTGVGEPVFADAKSATESIEGEKPSNTQASLDAVSNSEDLNQEFLNELESNSEDSPLDLSLEGGNEGLELEAVAEEDDGDLGIQEELTIQGKIEAVIFASPKPLRTVEIHELLLEQGHNLKEVQDALDELIEFYRDRAGGFHLKYIKRMGYQFQTTTAAKSLMEKQFSSRPRPLSRASLETLSVIAYRQKTNKTGVTRAEVEFIRGVDAGSIFKTLIERNLLTCVGRKEIPGRPMLFGVTDEFFKVFQLGSLNDLPPLESFQTPSDVVNAANEKIAQFEAEQEGVDPEEFIGDEEYTEGLGEGDMDVLAAEPAPFAPTVADTVRAETEIAEPISETSALDAIPADILAEMAADTLEDMTDQEKWSATQEEMAAAVPKDVIEELAADLLNKIDEGQVAYVVPAIREETREILGASAALETPEDVEVALPEVDKIEIVEDAKESPEKNSET